MSVVNWLLNSKPPRARRTCDYCNEPQRALKMRENVKIPANFCNWKCEAAYLKAVYRTSARRFETKLAN
jgi:hypothetical protein